MKLTLAIVTLLLGESLAYPESYPGSYPDSFQDSYPSSFQDAYPSSYQDYHQDSQPDSYSDYNPDSHQDYNQDYHPDSHPDSHPIYPIYYPENGQKLKCYGSDGWKTLVSEKLEDESCFSRCYAATGNEPIKKYIFR